MFMWRGVISITSICLLLFLYFSLSLVLCVFDDLLLMIGHDHTQLPVFEDACSMSSTDRNQRTNETLNWAHTLHIKNQTFVLDDSSDSIHPRFAFTIIYGGIPSIASEAGRAAITWRHSAHHLVIAASDCRRSRFKLILDAVLVVQSYIWIDTTLNMVLQLAQAAIADLAALP